MLRYFYIWWEIIKTLNLFMYIQGVPKKIVQYFYFSFFISVSLIKSEPQPPGWPQNSLDSQTFNYYKKIMLGDLICLLGSPRKCFKRLKMSKIWQIHGKKMWSCWMIPSCQGGTSTHYRFPNWITIPYWF